MRDQNRTETRERGRGRVLAAAFLLATAIAGAASLYATPPNQNNLDDPAISIQLSTPVDEAKKNDDHDDYHPRRSLSVSLPDGGCEITYAHLSPVRIAPTWQASYPGSGARMTWVLVQALTGIVTNDDFNSHERGYDQVVAVKTHYPVKSARRRFGELDPLFGRAMVVLRNPMDAIPSYFNLQYEHRNHLPNHSTRGPNDEWIEYRDFPGSGLDARINSYENFVSYWMEKYPDRRQLLVLSYEDLIGQFTGPLAATRIAFFLGETEGVNPIEADSIPCVWETVVDNNHNNNGAPSPVANGEVDAGAVQADDVAAEVQEVQEVQEVESPRMVNGRYARKDRPEFVQREKVDKEAESPQMVNGRYARKDRPEFVPREKKFRRNDEGNGRRALQFAEEHTLLNSPTRVGPKERPYTTENLKGFQDMFQRLIEKYSYDEDFVRIMQSYMKAVSNTIPQDD